MTSYKYIYIYMHTQDSHLPGFRYISYRFSYVDLGEGRVLYRYLVYMKSSQSLTGHDSKTLDSWICLFHWVVVYMNFF